MSPASTHTRREVNEFVKFWIHGDILYIGYKPNPRSNLLAARKIAVHRMRFQNGKNYPAIRFINQAKDFDKQACDHTATNDLLKIKAISYVGCHKLLVWLLRFYIRYYKPYPYKTSTREETLACITSYLEVS